jgi:hypothetical protein
MKRLFLLLLPVWLLAIPNAPTHLELTATATQVTLTWQDRSDNETGFKIFRNNKLIAVTPPDTTTYIDTGLSPHTTYTYTVKATNDTFYLLANFEENDEESRIADLFATYIQRSTGIELEPVDYYEESEDAVYFIIGKDNDYAAQHNNKLERSILGDDGFEISKNGKNIVIAGATTRGTLYGVYQYLREYMGWEWYGIDDDATRIRKVNSIVLPKTFRRYTPRFVYREVFSPEGGNGQDGNDGYPFSVKSMLNGQLGHRYIESYLKQKDGFGLDFCTVHNIQDAPIIANTQSAVQRVVDGVAYVYSDAPLNQSQGDLYKRPFNEEKDGLLSYAFVQHIDGSNRSFEENDIIFANTHQSDGAPLFELTRLSATAIKESFPHVKLLAEAYLWSLKPPQDLDMEDAGVLFAPIEMDWSKAIDEGTYNRRYWEYLNGWRKATDYIVTWLYTTNFQGYLQPLPTIYPMIRTIKKLAEKPEVKGIFLQDSYTTPAGSFAALHAWVYAKLMWDPSRDADELIREFVQGYYGQKAGEYIYTYIQLLHQAAAQHPQQILTKTDILRNYLNADFIIKADNLFQQAETAAENEWFKKHIMIERLGIDWVILQNSAKLKAEAQAKGLTWVDRSESDRLNRLARFKERVLNVAHMESFQEGGDKEALQEMLEALKVTRTIAQKPSLCEGVDEESCVDYQDIAFVLASAQNVADADASDNSAARMPGNTPEWGIQIPLKMFLPESGAWDIYAVVKIQKKSQDENAIALTIGVEPNGYEEEYYLRDFENNTYKTIKIAGSPYRYDAEQTIWFAPPDSEDITYFYVDRIFAKKVISE